MLENDVTELDLTFCLEEQEFGALKVNELIPGGAKISVTEENKLDYVQKVCYAKMAKDIKE